MKKFLVIGNPIKHSLSPKLHNYWFKKNNIDAVYEKRQIEEEDIKHIVSEIRNGILEGMNVTVPFKKSVIKFLDDLSPFASETQSVNTIYKEKNKIVGGEPILSHTISLRTVESEIANSLTKIQEKNKDVEIGSYPFFHAGKLGVSIVIRSEDQSKIDLCNSEILEFVNEKKIEQVDR